MTPTLRSEKPLSVEEARAMVDNLIAKGERLFVEHADSLVPLPEQLGPITREFFSKYASLHTKLGGFVLSVAEIRPSEYVQGYLLIGHSEDWDVVQKLGDDQVFVVEGAENSEIEMEVRFPSIYHLVLDEVNQA